MYPHQRFEAKLVDSASGCTLWTGAKKNDGSGLFVIKTNPIGRTCTTAQRYAYQFYIGPIPENHYVVSKCGNKLCVKHLRLKSRSEAIREAIKRGTWTQVKCKNLPPVKCGEKNPNAKYSDAFVQQIRDERSTGKKLIVLASQHGLAVSTVGFLCSKRKSGFIRNV